MSCNGCTCTPDARSGSVSRFCPTYHRATSAAGVDGQAHSQTSITLASFINSMKPIYLAKATASVEPVTVPCLMADATVTPHSGRFGYAPGPPRSDARAAYLEFLWVSTAAGRIRGRLERQAAASSTAASAQPSLTAGLARGALASGRRRAFAAVDGHGREVVRDGPDRGRAGRPPVANPAGGGVAAGAAVDPRGLA